MTTGEFRDSVLKYYEDKPVGFIEDNVRIECVGQKELIQPFKLWPAQKDTITSILENRMNVILKARQLGITWLVLAMCAWKLLTIKGFRIGAISRAEPEAMELVRRLELIFSYMPQLIVEEKNAPAGWDGPVYVKKALSVTIKFGEKESVFQAFLSNSSSGRGFTFNWLVLDEWAFHPWAEDLWASLFPTANNGSAKVIGLSTIERGSLFEQIFTSPDNGFNKIFIPWSADPSRDETWYRTTLGALGPVKTLQEYPATVEEALMVPGGQMFPEIKQETHQVDAKDGFWDGNVVRYVCMDYGLDMFAVLWVAINTEGKARIYREFNAPNLTIPAACDTYKSLLDEGEKITMILAPSDLWNRDQVHGRSRAFIFSDYGMNLTKVSRDFEGGVAAMKQWFTVAPDGKAWLTFENAPTLYRHLQKILKDPKRPDVYAKQPHELTHYPDALRYFCIWYTNPAEKAAEKRKAVWTEDMLEDYETADAELRARMEERYGKPA